MQVHQNFSLKNYNSFRIDICAKYFSTFRSVDELESLLGLMNKEAKMILGGGSNVLFTSNYDGLILKNEMDGIEVIDEDGEFVYVCAGAGVSWHSLVLYCVNNNYGGVENLSLIPGNVGASPMQNIGAYGVEIKDVFYQLEAYHLNEKRIVVFNHESCCFGYRESVFKNKFKNQFAILNVTYRLRKNPVFNISYGAIEAELEKMRIQELSVKSISDAVINIRTSKLPDPKMIGNAGSFFKNPVINKEAFDEFVNIQEQHLDLKETRDKESKIHFPFFQINDDLFKIPAGWLIEQCGYKGFRKGDVGCYERQALVLINYGHATGKEVYDFSEEIIQSVNDRFNINLEREVNII
jgi:UDP-N-acetylmuramate dehydrogenase